MYMVCATRMSCDIVYSHVSHNIILPHRLSKRYNFAKHTCHHTPMSYVISFGHTCVSISFCLYTRVRVTFCHTCMSHDMILPNRCVTRQYSVLQFLSLWVRIISLDIKTFTFSLTMIDQVGQATLLIQRGRSHAVLKLV